MRMGSPEELAEQEKEPTDDGGEPLLPPSRLERAHDHASCVELYAPEPPLTPNGERVKRRAPGGSVLICREGPAFQSSVLHRSFQSRE